MTRTFDPIAATAIDDVLAHIASAGSFFTGAERIAIVSSARAARGLAAPPVGVALPPVVTEAASRVAANAMATRQGDIDTWKLSGLDVLAYVELVAIVAEICSIDSYHFALGEEIAPLPAPVDGAPSPDVHPDAQVVNAWVPTVGIALAPTSLSALPTEAANKRALGEAWYLTDSIIHQYGEEPGREIGRPQMEFVAARTSWLNECFF